MRKESADSNIRSARAEQISAQEEYRTMSEKIRDLDSQITQAHSQLSRLRLDHAQEQAALQAKYDGLIEQVRLQVLYQYFEHTRYICILPLDPCTSTGFVVSPTAQRGDVASFLIPLTQRSTYPSSIFSNLVVYICRYNHKTFEH